MWYFISSRDAGGDAGVRSDARPEHVARLQALKDQGRLLTAGPFPAIDSEEPGPAGYTGALVIADFDSLEDARTWAEAEPYVKLGLYTEVVVKPFRKVLP